VFCLKEEHLDCCEDQEDSKKVENPVQFGDKLRPESDHRTAQEQGAEDAPKQHAVPVEWRHREEIENHCDHEDVVQAERLLDDVAGQVLPDPDHAERALSLTCNQRYSSK
jgi:hypothetical protein